MSLIHEILNQQLRQLLKTKRRSQIAQRSRNRWCYQCNRRYRGGEDSYPVTSTQTETVPISSHTRLRRQATLPVGNHCIVPLLHIWLRLNDVAPTSSHATRQRCMHRIRLRQRSLLDNVRQVIRIHWNNFRSMFLPGIEQITIGIQTGRHQQVEIVRNPNPNRFTWLQKLRKRILTFADKTLASFLQLSKQLESSFSTVGPSPGYVYASPAMELINLGDLIEGLNSALIDHLIDNVDYAISPTQSLTQLGLFFAE